MRFLAILALAACSAPRPPAARPALSTMDLPLAVVVEPAVANTIPDGVSSADTLFVTSTRGIDALDPATGATRWSTGEANVPVLALPHVLLAIRGAGPGDAMWSGPGTLVAIELDGTHATRRGPVLDLPLAHHMLLDARVVAGRLVAGWHATADNGSPAGIAPSPDEAGSIAIDLASGAVAVRPESDVPAAVRTALSGITSLRPPWRTEGGWSAITIRPDPVTKDPQKPLSELRHWPDTGEPRAIALERADIRELDVRGVTARHAFVASCTARPCELRVLDAETGELVRTLPDPLADRIGGPYALFDARWLGVQSETYLARTLIAVDVDGRASAPRWRRSIAAERPPNLMP